MKISERQKTYVNICREIGELTDQIGSVTPGEAGEIAARIDDLQAAARELRLAQEQTL
jgi:hypothetical protein